MIYIQIANPSVNTDAAKQKGTKCAWEHAIHAARGAIAFLLELLATKMFALAMPPWPPMVENTNALKFISFLIKFPLINYSYIYIFMNIFVIEW